MNCDELKEQLVDLLYHELPPEQRRSLEEHMGECSSCRMELLELEETRRLLAPWEVEPLREKLVFVEPPARRFRLLPSYLGPARIAYALAASLVLALALLALANAEFAWEEGRFSFRTSAFGSLPSRPAESSNLMAQRAAAEELVRIFDRMIADSEFRQYQLFASMLEEAMRQVELRRRDDLQRIAEGLDLSYRSLLGMLEQNNRLLASHMKTSER